MSLLTRFGSWGAWPLLAVVLLPFELLGQEQPPATVPARIVNRVVVVLQERSECSGFVMSATTVLTAGHCVDENGQESKIAIKPNTADERRVLATLERRAFDATNDIAVLNLKEPLAFDDFEIACPPDYGTRAVIVGFPLGQDRGDSTKPFATSAFSEVVYSGGRYSRDDRDIVSMLEFSPYHGARVTHGSSGSPVLIWKGGDWALLGVHASTSKNEDGTDVKHNATTVAAFFRSRSRCFQAPTEQQTHLKVSAGRCFKPREDGAIVYEGDCLKAPVLMVEYSNLPDRFSLSVEVLEEGSKALVDAFTYSDMEGGTGLRSQGLRFRSDKFSRLDMRLQVRVRVKEMPHLVDTLGPVVIPSPVELRSAYEWEDDGVVVTLNMSLVRGDVKLALRCGEAGEDTWSGNFTVKEHGWRRYDGVEGLGGRRAAPGAGPPAGQGHLGVGYPGFAPANGGAQMICTAPPSEEQRRLKLSPSGTTTWVRADAEVPSSPTANVPSRHVTTMSPSNMRGPSSWPFEKRMNSILIAFSEAT